MRHDLCVFFNDTATTEIYTLSLHDALPIYCGFHGCVPLVHAVRSMTGDPQARSDVPTAGEDHTVAREGIDRKSTRLNSSHANISYAVFCLKKKQQLAHAALRDEHRLPLRRN